ncbi:MAG: hypothetical protein WBP65_09545 [Candidatus Sulfotelmatobacter sp.]
MTAHTKACDANRLQNIASFRMPSASKSLAVVAPAWTFVVNSTTGLWGTVQSISKGIAWLSLLLTLWSAVAFAVHRHSSQDESTTCQVCVAAHSASPTNAAPTPKPVFRRVVAFRPRPTAAKQHLVAFALYVRPPPSV